MTDLTDRFTKALANSICLRLLRVRRSGPDVVLWPLEQQGSHASTERDR